VSTTAEMAVYVDSIKLLLLSPSAVAYAEHLLECTTKTWSQPFARHWLDVIHPSIHLLGAWEQRKYGEELLTTNRSESFNAALKKLMMIMMVMISKKHVLQHFCDITRLFFSQLHRTYTI